MPAGPLTRKGIVGDFDTNVSYTHEDLETRGYKLMGKVFRRMKDPCVRYDKGLRIVTLFKEEDGLLRLERLVDFEHGSSYGL